MIGNIIEIYFSEVPVIILGVAERSKLGYGEGSVQVYHVALVRVRWIETLSIGVNILRNQHFKIHWDKRVDM